MEGFWYNGKHSDDFHCYFIPDESDRWFASPDFEVYETTDTGKDGGYFYGTKAKVRAFTLKCFYEDATIQQREALRRWLDRNTSGQLIFDRRPFVHYDVRPTKVVQGKRWTSLAAGTNEELYNGTLTITFSAYQPYGILNYKEYTDFDDEGATLYCGMLEHDMMPILPGDNTSVDFTSATTRTRNISTNNVWVHTTGNTSYFIAVPDGVSNFIVTANASKASVVALLKTASAEPGDTPDYATGASRVTIAAGETEEFILPADCHYVCILQTYSSADYTPASAVFVADRSGIILIYNCGTQTCYPVFRVSGTAPNGLVITNHTNNTACRLTRLPSTGYLEIDGNLGSVTWVHGASRDLAFSYHEAGFVTLEPYMACEDDVVVSYTSGSTAIIQPNGMFDDRYKNKYLYCDESWKRVVSVNSDGSAVIDSAPASTNIENAKLVTMNQISVAGNNLVLTRFEVDYAPKIV